jgi:hypothetical protein
LRTDLVFNELSLLPPSPTILGARGVMDNFISTIKACRTHGIGTYLRTPMGFHASEIATGYPVARWLNDQGVDREKRLFIGTLATKAPYFEDLLGTTEARGFDEAEFAFNGVRADGLGVAYLLDAVGISASTSPLWNATSLRIIYRTLNDESSEIEEKEVDVRHVSAPEHSNTHAAELRNDQVDAIVSGSRLWDARAELFTRLAFCESVGPQLAGLTSGTGGLSIVFRSLMELQALCEAWTDGTFDSRGIPNTTRESGATLQQFGEERTFTGPDGVARVFSWHIKRGSIRIHFVPDAENKSCLIGYVGPHLRTVKYK